MWCYFQISYNAMLFKNSYSILYTLQVVYYLENSHLQQWTAKSIYEIEYWERYCIKK